MIFSIEHEIPGRLRLRCPGNSFSREEGYVIVALLETQPGVVSAVASHRTGSLLIRYAGEDRSSILKTVEVLDESFYGGIDGSELAEANPETLGGSLMYLFTEVLGRSLLPRILRNSLIFLRALPILVKGMCSMWQKKGLKSVPVLDAAVVGVSMLRRDFRTAAVITTLLAVSDILESWTYKKSKESLADSLALNIDKVWTRKNGEDALIPLADLQIGDVVIARSGSVVPVDGVVQDGEAMVNQSALTGESESVRRTAGVSVYAGTMIEEGELFIRVTAFDKKTRIYRIVEMINSSEALKVDIQNRAEKMADSFVPYSFMLAGGIYLWTRNAMRAISVLMVDYSCAIKLATPLIILSAMREGSKHGIMIKGGKFLEALAESDTVVFDKTGTLTASSPIIAEVFAFEGYSRETLLRIAACLEEHFPHSVARAVVKQAEKENLSHREEHSTVEYVATHSVVSRLRDEKVMIGSTHFIFDDKKVLCTPEQRELINRQAEKYSILYLTVKDRLIGILCIEDPLRDDACGAVKRLRSEGITRVVMLTGDNYSVAKNVADMIGIDKTLSELLPEDKTDAVKLLKQDGKVIMVGNGINDSPALSVADVGITLRDSADITREVADVILLNNNLNAIADARRLGAGTMEKIRRNYSFIIVANSLLLLLGMTGTITPVMSVFLHSLATVGSSAYGLTPIFRKTEEPARD